LPSEHAILAAFVVLVVGTLVVLTLRVWPGLSPTPSCGQPGSTMLLNDALYCARTVPMPHLDANYTAWGYAFALHVEITPGGLFLHATILEPNGASAAGVLSFFGPVPPNTTRTWFTPDSLAGVSASLDSYNVTLFVRGGG
jgi:hypothetical protein